MPRFVSVVFVFLIGFVLRAQPVYTLQQCIDSALKNNIIVQQRFLLMQSAQIDWRQTKSNLLPSMIGSVFHGTSQGKSIDPSSNNYVNQNLNYANYQVGSSVTLFSGGSLINQIRQYASAYEAAKMEWQQAKDNLVLEVILAYLQVLNNEDLLNSSLQQATVSQKQLERYQVLDLQGAIKPSDLSDLKGQLMNDQLLVLSNRSAVDNAKLLLLQLMNKIFDGNLQVQRINEHDFLDPNTNSAEEIFQKALVHFSMVKSVRLRKESYQYAVRSAKGFLYPNIFLNAGLNTRYSSVQQNLLGKVPYKSQLSNNLSSFAEVGISLPIFNRSIYRNRVRQATIQFNNSALLEQNSQLTLHVQIDQAFLNMTHAYERFKILVDQVKAYESSFKAAEIRFNAGVGNTVDYLTAKDRLDRARINLITAKYDFALRKKILEYYSSNAATP